ncbi:MAG TPA: 6-hydroxymethylpterin diphosphokinase MptE-like protein, partial [bacterium]|nr:6-hydroxymethylpterin diphosphokinase MptE-like protein [bacterium]
SAAMVEAKKHGWPVMRRVPSHKDFISVVCYGPSLKDTWRYIPRPIMTVSGAHDYLLERGVVPDFHLDCDPREHKARMLKKAHPEVHYLMASVCNPLFWEKLAGHKVSLWHLHNGPETDVWLKENDPKTPPVGGGTTAGSRALQVANLMGYERFHIFGMDCSFSSETQRHAGEHLGKTQKAIQVICGDRAFISSPQMVESARETLLMIQNYEIWMYFHGDGLQQEMIRNYQTRFGVVPEKLETIHHGALKEASHG